MEIRRRDQVQMMNAKGKIPGSQNKSNLKKTGPKVMIDKYRASKSMLNVPKQ
jgi:hypothetical protein